MHERIDPISVQRAGWASPSTLRAEQVESLRWPELMEAHRAACMALFREQGVGADDLDPAPAAGRLADLCRLTARRLLRDDSPYRPRRAAVWQSGAGEEPTFEGVLVNPSVSHLGSLEVLDLDAEGQPIAVRMIPFADIRAVRLGGDALYRAARVERRSGETQIVTAPLLYATSFETTEDLYATGSLTGFVCHLDLEELSGGAGVGLGHQDLFMGGRLFGIGSVEEIQFLE